MAKRDIFVKPVNAATDEIVNLSQIRNCWVDISACTVFFAFGGANKSSIRFKSPKDTEEFFKVILEKLRVELV